MRNLLDDPTPTSHPNPFWSVPHTAAGIFQEHSLILRILSLKPFNAFLTVPSYLTFFLWRKRLCLTGHCSSLNSRNPSLLWALVSAPTTKPALSLPLPYAMPAMGTPFWPLCPATSNLTFTSQLNLHCSGKSAVSAEDMPTALGFIFCSTCHILFTVICLLSVLQRVRFCSLLYNSCSA